MATFSELQSILGHDVLSPMYQALGGQGNPFQLVNAENGLTEYLGGNQATALGFDPSFFDPYTFDFQQSGPGNSGTLTAFKDGNQVWQGSQYDTPFSETLRDAALTAGAAFGGLGLMGAGPLGGALGSLGSSIGGSFGGNALSGLAPEVGGGMFDIGSIFSGSNLGNLLNVGGNLLSGYMGSKASGKASDALTAAGRESNALQKYIFDTIRADNQPLLDLRNQTLPQINALMADPSSITSDPGYQFGLDQGMKSLDQSAASRGMLYSGAQMKGAQQFGQDYAGTKLTDSLNRLMGVAGLGQVGASGNAQAGQNYGTNVGNTLQNMGNARASGYVGSANAWGNALGNAYNNWQFNDIWGKKSPSPYDPNGSYEQAGGWW